jgi:hypothetical protein
MRLPEHESEGDNEELITEIVVDVQDAAAPIFEAARLDKGSHDTGRVITCFREVVYYSAVAINQSFLQVRALKMTRGMFSLLRNDARDG